MRILTIRPPYAQAVIVGAKTVENRVKNVAGTYRGPVAIHAGQALARDAWLTPGAARDWLSAYLGSTDGDWGRDLVYGAILGLVDLVDVHLSRPSSTPANYGRPVCFDDSTLPGVSCSEWAEEFAWPGGYHLVLANPRPLLEPIPFKGALGLRHLDEETTARVWAGVA